jgi:hypothetical protein
VVSQPCEASWEIGFSGCVVCGPFVDWGAKGEEEYPYHWLGGTGEVFTISKKEAG